MPFQTSKNNNHQKTCKFKVSKQSKEELQQKKIERNYDRNELDNLLLYESHKVVIGSGYFVYCDGTIGFYSKSKKDKGFRIPKALLKWVKLPKKESQSIKLQADFYFEVYENKNIIFENVNIELYNKKLETHFAFFVYPFGQESKENLIKSRFKNKEKIFCFIKSENLKKHFKFTKEFKERSKVRLETKLPVQYKNLELIVRGELRGTSFEIYQTKDRQIVIKICTKMKLDGAFALPLAIKDSIQDWLIKSEYIVCSKDNETPIVLRSKLRKMGSVLIKELAYDYYGDYQDIELLMTNKDWNLTEKALLDKDLREFLEETGFNIEMIRTAIPYTRTHYKNEIANQLRGIINTAFAEEDSVVTFETEVTTQHIFGENKTGEKIILDSLVLIKNKEKNASTLLLFELKSSISSSKNSVIKEAIGKFLHYKRKLGNSDRIVPIVIYPTEWTKGKTADTKRFGERIGVLLIEEKEIDELIKNPKMLQDKVLAFIASRLRLKEKGSVDYNLLQCTDSIIFENKDSLTDSDIYILNKYDRLILETLPKESRILRKNSREHKGSLFENQVKEALEEEGYEVLENVVLEVYGKAFEIDLLGIKNGEILIVECRDGQGLSSKDDIETQIKTKISKTELIKNLTNAQKARIYVKLSNFTKEMKDKYSSAEWIKDVSIDFIESEMEKKA